MAITFFHMHPGPFAERCLIALRLKQVPFDEVVVEPALGENRTPDFYKLNPRGTLPVLRDGNVVVRKSQAIVFYLDGAYPAPPLYGATPQEAGAIMQAIWDQTSYIEPLLKGIIGPLVFRKGDPSRIDAVEEMLVTELKTLDGLLAHSGWIVGNNVSAADISLYPLLVSVLTSLQAPVAEGRCRGVLDALENLPNIGVWLAAIAELDGVAKRIPV